MGQYAEDIIDGTCDQSGDYTHEDNVQPMCGTLRITNPKTLRRWIKNGNYQKEIDKGLVFNVGCGRFREEKCTCYKCRTRKRKELQDIIDEYNDYQLNILENNQELEQ